MSDHFAVIFKGECLDYTDPNTVRDNIGKIFNASGDKLDKLFSGGKIVVRRNLDRASADKLVQVFNKAGAKVYLSELAPSAIAPAAPAAPAASSAAQSPATDNPSAPPNTSIDLPIADLSDLSLAAMQGYLVEPAADDPTPAPVAIDADIAPVGSILGESKIDTTPAPEVPSDWRTE